MENGRHNTAFSYSNEQANSIIVTQSLLDGTTNSSGAEPDVSKKYFELKRMAEKEIKLHWSIVNLSDYWREGRIPRGLRIKKFPSFGIEDTDFRSKWEAILNKCSLDLILLIIEHSKKEKEAIQEKLNEIKVQISGMSNDDTKLPFENKLKQDLEKLTDWVRQQKIKKFKRDENDYKEDRVYKWTRSNHRDRQRQRSVSFNLTTSNEESTSISNMSSPTASMSDFLDERPKHIKSNIRRRKQGEAENGQGQQQLKQQPWNLRDRNKSRR